MKGSGFVFDYVHFLYYIYPKINPNGGESYIKQKGNKFCQYKRY